MLLRIQMRNSKQTSCARCRPFLARSLCRCEQPHKVPCGCARVPCLDMCSVRVRLSHRPVYTFSWILVAANTGAGCGHMVHDYPGARGAGGSAERSSSPCSLLCMPRPVEAACPRAELNPTCTQSSAAGLHGCLVHPSAAAPLSPQPHITLRVHLPATYPSQHPPVFELGCDMLSGGQLGELAAELEAMFAPGGHWGAMLHACWVATWGRCPSLPPLRPAAWMALPHTPAALTRSL